MELRWDTQKSRKKTASQNTIISFKKIIKHAFFDTNQPDGLSEEFSQAPVSQEEVVNKYFVNSDFFERLRIPAATQWQTTAQCKVSDVQTRRPYQGPKSVPSAVSCISSPLLQRVSSTVGTKTLAPRLHAFEWTVPARPPQKAGPDRPQMTIPEVFHIGGVIVWGRLSCKAQPPKHRPH